MFEKLKNKENLGKIWKRATDVAKVISGEFTDSFKSIQQKVKEKSEDWEDLEEAKVDETKVDETKVDEAKVDETKVDETKVDETKVDKTKVNKTKVNKTKVDKTKVDEVNASKS
jgi:hypothetical protein